MTYVHAHDFSFFTRTEVQTRYKVDDEHDGVGYDKGPCDADTDPCDLLAQLDPVPITEITRLDQHHLHFQAWPVLTAIRRQR